MAMQVIQKPQVSYEGVGSLAGALAGGIAGSVVPGLGTLVGASTGMDLAGKVGRMADGLMSKSPSMQNVGGGSEAGAIARRNAQAAQDNLKSLREAEASVAQLPERERQQYAPAIIKARMMAEAERGLA